MFPDLQCFDLEFLDFRMVWRWCVFKRNFTLNFEFWSSPSWKYTIRYFLLILSKGNQPQFPVNHKRNNSNPYSHSVPIQTFGLLLFSCSFTFSISSVQSLSRVWLFATPWIAARQASLSITNSRGSPRPRSIESVMPSVSSSVVPFSSCPQSFPASGFFQMSQLLTSGGQSTGVSASTSVLPMNTQDWSPLGWTDWIFLQSKGLSRVFSNTTVQKHQFFCTQLSL